MTFNVFNLFTKASKRSQEISPVPSFIDALDSNPSKSVKDLRITSRKIRTTFDLYWQKMQSVSLKRSAVEQSPLKNFDNLVHEYQLPCGYRSISGLAPETINIVEKSGTSTSDRTDSKHNLRVAQYVFLLIKLTVSSTF